MVQMLGLSALGAVAGGWIKRRLPVLDRLNIPAPIVGGMVYALIALLMRDRVVNLEADDGLRNLLQKYWVDRQPYFRSPFTLEDRPQSDDTLLPNIEFSGEDVVKRCL